MLIIELFIIVLVYGVSAVLEVIGSIGVIARAIPGWIGLLLIVFGFLNLLAIENLRQHFWKQLTSYIRRRLSQQWLFLLSQNRKRANCICLYERRVNRMILFTILLIMLFVLLIASAITILIMGIGGIAFVLACSDIIICIYLVFIIIRHFIKRKK